MKSAERVKALEKLGQELTGVLNGEPGTQAGMKLMGIIPSLHVYNAWFTPDNVRFRITEMAASLNAKVLEQWLGAYSLPDHFSGKNIGVISAGNIPAAGFDDLLAVFLSGHRYTGKLSADDNRLLPVIIDILQEQTPEAAGQITFTEGKLEKPDAVIATGSNNSSRYFEYYFGKYPHIIRKNRNSIAILDGTESEEELKALGEDIFRYYGLGCRNITKLYVSENYTFDSLFEAIVDYGTDLIQNRKYMNNYEYNRTLYLLNNLSVLDNNFLILKEDAGIASPPGVLFYERFSSEEDINKNLRANRELIQCIVGHGHVPFGKAQCPAPWEYADGVDTLKFLLTI